MPRWVLALCSIAILITVVACQPQIIEVEKPVTRIVEIPIEVVVEKPVEVAVTRIVEKTVEIVVTSVVEMPVEIISTRVVERIATRVVERPVERIATRVVERPTPIAVTGTAEQPAEKTSTRSVTDVDPVPTVTRVPENGTPTRTNVAPLGWGPASHHQESARMAIDGDVDSVWNSANHAVQWIIINLNSFSQVDGLQLVVAQTPAGETSHEIWFEDV